MGLPDLTEGDAARSASDGSAADGASGGLPDGGTDQSTPQPDGPSVSLDGPADTAPDTNTTPDVSQSVDSPPSMCGAGGLCEEIAKDYQAALARAKVCDPSFKGQCLSQAPSSLACGCPVWVNTTTETDAQSERWEKNGCGQCKAACPAVLCRRLNRGVCNSLAVAASDPIIIAPLGRGTCGDSGLIIANP
jgi:hypothetical protein